MSRVLVPYTNQLFISLLKKIMSPQNSFLLSYLLYDLFAIFFSLVSIFYFLKLFFSIDQSMVGTLFVACSMPFTFNEAYSPWTLLQPGLFSLCLIFAFVNKKQYLPFMLLMIVATLNRETSIFIPAILFLAHFDIRAALKLKIPQSLRDHLKQIVMLLVIYIIIRSSLYLYLGSEAINDRPFSYMFHRNIQLEWARMAFIRTSVFFGFCWIFVILGYKTAPLFIKRVSLIIPVYFSTIAIYAVWTETRLLTPMYPILAALLLSFIYRTGTEDSRTPDRRLSP